MALLLGACAQVGTISGGPADVFAPKVLEQTITDRQCSVNANVQLLVFDEFIKLDQPQQRITLMPADSRLQYELKGKTLRILFLDALQPQTTYTLMSNGGIKDLTEGNDSLMTWTFSTGPVLDSLELFAEAKEILPNTKQTTIQLGVYQTDTSKTARYIGRFDPQGQLHLKGLKEGAYFLKAYIDENQDGFCSALESQDALFEPIQLGQIQNDTLRFFLSKPTNEKDSSSTSNQIIKSKIDTSTVKNPLSTLIIDLDTSNTSLLVELYLGAELKQKTRVEQQRIILDSLEAGQYTLRIVFDQNLNGQWDPIDLQQQIRAEGLYFYPEKINLRPNWELSLQVNIPPSSLFTN